MHTKVCMLKIVTDFGERSRVRIGICFENSGTYYFLKVYCVLMYTFPFIVMVNFTFGFAYHNV